MQVNENKAYGHLSEMRGVGQQLGAAKDTVLYESRQGSDVFQLQMGDIMDGLDPSSWKGAFTALMVENTRKEFGALDEATKLINIGSFEKYAYPLIRGVFPNLIAHEIVSVQPMPGPTSIIFYMQFIYNMTKGTARAGQSLESHPNYEYSSERIDQEQIGDTGDTLIQVNLAFVPVKHNSVYITDGAQIVTDDGQGNLVGDVDGGGTNTIDYATGAIDVTLASAAGAAVVTEYEYDMEMNDLLPEIDLNLSQSPVTAAERKLRTKWSIESQQDLKNLHGLDAEVELVGGIGNELKFEIDGEISGDVRRIAALTAQTWYRTPESGISYTEHKLSFVDYLVWASNGIHKALGGRGFGTFIVAGLEVCNVIETLPGFKAEGNQSIGRGVHYIGTLNGRWRIYKNTFYPDYHYTMGYKNTDQMFEVGYVWAPYIMAFTTPTVMLDDFKVRKGIASRYGKKAINGKFYINGQIDPAAAP
jgi:hypothetical protein